MAVMTTTAVPQTPPPKPANNVEGSPHSVSGKTNTPSSGGKWKKRLSLGSGHKRNASADVALTTIDGPSSPAAATPPRPPGHVRAASEGGAATDAGGSGRKGKKSALRKFKNLIPSSSSERAGSSSAASAPVLRSPAAGGAGSSGSGAGSATSGVGEYREVQSADGRSGSGGGAATSIKKKLTGGKTNKAASPTNDSSSSADVRPGTPKNLGVDGIVSGPPTEPPPKKNLVAKIRDNISPPKERPEAGDEDNNAAGTSSSSRMKEISTQSSIYEEAHHRDGFCRRVDSYDGQIIVVDSRPTYEVGNYLGGGVAGVVYEGTRLLPISEYPVRTGYAERERAAAAGAAAAALESPYSSARYQVDNEIVETQGNMCSALCAPSDAMGASEDNGSIIDDGAAGGICAPMAVRSSARDRRAMAAADGAVEVKEGSGVIESTPQGAEAFGDDIAFEIPRSPTGDSNAGEMIPIMDAIDAPSRSTHYARAASRADSATASAITGGLEKLDLDESDYAARAASPFSATGKMLMVEETVAVKILNPVGYRLLSNDSIRGAVVVKEGEPLTQEVIDGSRPMEEHHVWWLVNPNSRNLRTLQKTGPAGDNVDRGSSERGLRLSLVAAFVDPKTNLLKELPLTRCIEIWGHAPFGASEAEFDAMMDAIERINAGQPPTNYASPPPSRVGTEESGASSGQANTNGNDGYLTPVQVRKNMFRKTESQTGLARAMAATRITVYCAPLNAYIACPAVPPKYLRWLRQRRAATKEIRHMMQIGRHRNVVHLYEVLELVQDSKSTMFLILELVRGGELFDLISSQAGKSKDKNGNKVRDPNDDPEARMLKFFKELASGIAYCHDNGIAHRDLKPENLLVHNDASGGQTLKIADFGLSATFHLNAHMNRLHSTDFDLMSEVGTIASPTSSNIGSPWSEERETIEAAPSPIATSLKALGQTAMSFLTCGSAENVVGLGACFPGYSDESNQPEPLRRMTSIVGSPHYVAPEIISQSSPDKKKKKSPEKSRSASPDSTDEIEGYDGCKADVWSAGVILYAMLFRSLPFGEDLLRCPRFQSFKKWYVEARKKGGRRSSAQAALDPIFTPADEEELLGPHWFFPTETSRESRDLIVAMLNPNAHERLSIDMVLRHPWVLSYRE